MKCYKEELGDYIDIEYSGDGHEMAQRFYIPVLKLTKKYDRVSGYFSVDSLVVIATGLAGLIQNNGSVRLIVGLHDLGPELKQAYTISRERAQELVEHIGAKVAEGLESTEDVLSKKRLEAIAWMLVEGHLEIKVAVPKRTILGTGRGIFHQKRLVLYDEDECIVTATGSANETKSAWDHNGENLTVFKSWKAGNLEYITRHRDRFEALWTDVDPYVNVFTLPYAVEHKLREKYYPTEPPKTDPEEESEEFLRLNVDECGNLVPAARLVKEIGKLKGLSHLGLGPVRLYPHQTYVMQYALDRFPHRVLIADEVGLGKTIEVGAVVKRLIEKGTAERVLILSPKNVNRQWQEEMWYHFNLFFWRLETGPKRLISPTGEERLLGDSNPFDRPGIDLLIASWHYARGTRRREPELLQSSTYYDLVVVDEAHAARRARTQRENKPTRLNELCMELSITSPHLILVTATPVQLNELEAWDLLRILGLGGPWAHESSFKRYYSLLQKGSEDPKDWVFAFNLASWVGRNYLSESEKETLINSIVPDVEDAMNLLRVIELEVDSTGILLRLIRDNLEALKQILVAFSPIHWFMVRNNRARLTERGYVFPDRIIDEVPVELEQRHLKILEELDTYLRHGYGLYERLFSRSNRGTYGLVKTVYHQRFVSSFTASLITIQNRKSFLTAVLREDYDAILKIAAKLLEDMDWEEDELDFIEATINILNQSGGRAAIETELEQVTSLEDMLLGYAPGNLTHDDPKMRHIQGQVEELVGLGRRVLVFSKYTDTVDAIVEYLGGRSSLGKSRIGVYTGRGGQLYDADDDRYVYVSKMDVRRALDEARILVLVCSEAASEGLNLQSASAVINVDMPWNPAKVEQRIGRVDRLGQVESQVIIRNVWYPMSIEAEMYRRLFKRKNIYSLVVGPAQEIISKGLVQALDTDARGKKLTALVEDVLRKVEDLRADSFDVYKGAAWEGIESQEAPIIDLLWAFCFRAAEALGLEAREENDCFVLSQDPRVPDDLNQWNGASKSVGKPNALTAAHPILLWLANTLIEVGQENVPRVEKSLFVVRDHDGLGTLLEVPYEGGASIVHNQLDDIIVLLDEAINGGSG